MSHHRQRTGTKTPGQDPRSKLQLRAARAARNPFGDGEPDSWSPRDDGATKLIQVPPELMEIARRMDEGAAAGALTPVVPPPTSEITAAMSAYTAPLSALRTRADAGMQDLPRWLPVERESLSTQPPPSPEHSLLRTCWISVGLAVLVLVAYYAPSLLARLYVFR